MTSINSSRLSSAILPMPFPRQTVLSKRQTLCFGKFSSLKSCRRQKALSFGGTRDHFQFGFRPPSATARR